jgi:RNA polymerase sigma-70 factor, ECF subfamily
VPPSLDLKTVYENEFRFVWRSLARLGVPSQDLADASQEVFIVVHRRLSEFDQKCKVSTWLYRICFNVASERRKRAYVRREWSTEPFAFDTVEADTAMPTADLELFDWLLEGMELDQRAVFVLFEVEGYCGPEIAEMLSCPLPTVYSRLRLARATFARRSAQHQAKLAHSMRRAAI